MQPLRRYPALDTSIAAGMRDRSPLFGRTERFVAMGAPDVFRMTVTSVPLGRVRLSAVSTTGHAVRPVDEKNATLLAPWRGTLRTDDGRREVAIREGEFTLPRPGRRSTLIPARYLGIVVQVPLAFLATCSARNPEDEWDPQRVWPTRFRADRGAGAVLYRQIRYLIQDLDAEDTLLDVPAAASRAADLVAELMLECFRAAAIEDSAWEATAASMRQVERAEAMIHAQAHGPISVPEIAASVGVGTRALQLAFRRHRGVTPSAFIAACRLEAIRARLLAAPRGVSVTTVALECGVTHLGRFAMQYRKRFGELPSVTLARSTGLN